MLIKDLQDIASEMVVTFFKLSTKTLKAMILAKFSKMMAIAQTITAKEDNNLMHRFDWSMNLGVLSDS